MISYDIIWYNISIYPEPAKQLKFGPLDHQRPDRFGLKFDIFRGSIENKYTHLDLPSCTSCAFSSPEKKETYQKADFFTYLENPGIFLYIIIILIDVEVPSPLGGLDPGRCGKSISFGSTSRWPAMCWKKVPFLWYGARNGKDEWMAIVWWF